MIAVKSCFVALVYLVINLDYLGNLQNTTYDQMRPKNVRKQVIKKEEKIGLRPLTVSYDTRIL
jgi:hypothetical protein